MVKNVGRSAFAYRLIIISNYKSPKYFESRLAEIWLTEFSLQDILPSILP